MFRKGKWIFGLLLALVVMTNVTGCCGVDLGKGIIREIREYKDGILQEIGEIKDGFLEEIHERTKEDEQN